MEIGAQLKKAREEKRLSQQEVADHLGISQKTLSNIESDKSSPSISQLGIMAELYEINILEMLSNQGISLNGQAQKLMDGTEMQIGFIKALYEKLIKEKDLRIKDLEEILTLHKKNKF